MLFAFLVIPKGFDDPLSCKKYKCNIIINNKPEW